MVVLLAEYYSCNSVQMNVMGGACDTCGGQDRCVQDFGREM